MPIGDAYVHMLLQKRFLQHGHYYAGICRNARIARWDEPTQRFYHWREKFGLVFQEDIEYWDPDGHFDQFIPLLDLGAELPKPIELPVKE